MLFLLLSHKTVADAETDEKDDVAVEGARAISTR